MHKDSRDRALQLWDELSDFEASQFGAATTHLMAVLCAQVGAWNATWAGAIRLEAARENDPLEGWRVGAVQALHPVAPHSDERHFREILKVWDRREIDPSFLLPLREVGRFRSYSFRRELPPEWFASPFYERHYGSIDTYDVLFVAFPLNDDCESHFGFYSRAAFTDAMIADLCYALRGIRWFHRHLMLGSGLMLASAPLTPAERRVLQLLLTQAPEKEIARRLDMAVSTAHRHVTTIFRKFGVRSRAGLMSLWLNGLG